MTFYDYSIYSYKLPLIRLYYFESMCLILLLYYYVQGFDLKNLAPRFSLLLKTLVTFVSNNRLSMYIHP